MKLTIHGPNLIDQSKGTFHVHTADCRDNKREVRLNGSVGPITHEFTSAYDVAEFIYADHIAEGSTRLDDDLLLDFHFAPCCKQLPTKPGETPAVDNTKRAKIDARVESNTEKATHALAALLSATSDADRLAAAQTLESAACQLRRALKDTVQS